MTVFLQFPLDIEDDWPPFGSESLPFDEVDGGYLCLSAPLFVRNLSVGDVIQVSHDKSGIIHSWEHVRKSNRSTVWLLRLDDDPPIETCLGRLRSLQCNTTGLNEFGCYAVDVPAELEFAKVDAVLGMMDEALVAVAFPSMRHSD